MVFFCSLHVGYQPRSLHRVERIRKSKIAPTVFSSLRQVVLFLKKGVFSRHPQKNTDEFYLFVSLTLLDLGRYS